MSLGRILLNDMAIQDKFLNNIVATAKKYGFRDIHFDFEYLRPADREAYNSFLRKAKARFQKRRLADVHCPCPKDKCNPKRKMV